MHAYRGRNIRGSFIPSWNTQWGSCVLSGHTTPTWLLIETTFYQVYRFYRYVHPTPLYINIMSFLLTSSFQIMRNLHNSLLGRRVGNQRHTHRFTFYTLDNIINGILSWILPTNIKEEGDKEMLLLIVWIQVFYRVHWNWSQSIIGKHLNMVQ